MSETNNDLESSTPPQIDQLDHSTPAAHPGEKPFRRVLTGFIIHFAVYVLVNAWLVFLDLRKPDDGYWVQWVIGGWGIGVLFHGVAVFLKWKKAKSSTVH